MNTDAPPAVPKLDINLAELPALLDYEGIKKHLAPIGRTTLYILATKGEIQSGSFSAVGATGKRMFVTKSVADWLERRMAASKPPKLSLGKQAPATPTPA